MTDKLNINDGYKKPIKTFTEKLTKNEIKTLLEEYKQEDIKNITKGLHVRYFIKDKDGQLLFRMGGALKDNSGLPTYVVLTNGKKSWSVQVDNTIFYVKMSNKQELDECKTELYKTNIKLNTLITDHTNALNELNKLKKENEKLKQKIGELNKKLKN